MTDALRRLATAAGILPGYRDSDRVWHETGPDTQIALLAAMGIDAGSARRAADALAAWQAAAPRRPGWQVVAAGQRPAIDPAADWRIALESGQQVEGRGPADLPDLPIGFHRMWQGARPVHLLAAPAALPADPAQGWGVTLSLAGLRSAETGGIGDYRDLGDAAVGLAGLGAGFVGINPVHAGFPTDPAAISPYMPSHRGRFDITHIALPERFGTPGPEIDFGADRPTGQARLRAAFAAFEAAGGDPAFDAWAAAGGAALDRFARHQALSDRHGPYWHLWPAALRNADAAAMAAAEPGHDGRFHAWAQWQAETQLAAAQAAARQAGMARGLYLDLAVGTHPHGAETWERPELFARGTTLGAPPDAFAPQGQSWGLAPLDPQAMVADGFSHFADTLARQMAHAGMIRIDHALGLMRSFWVPDGGVPGGFVAMPFDALLAVIRIVAWRADCTVVGEDLGLVPPGLSEALAASGLLGSRLMMFEWDGEGAPRPPAAYPAPTLAAFSTHDLPTWEGWRTGRDIALRAALGIVDARSTARQQAQRAVEVAAFEAMIGGTSARALHAALGRTGSRLVAVQAADALGLRDQANLPGTVDEYPNWRQRLPVDAGALAHAPGMIETARILGAARRHASPAPPRNL
jgi:4-alpha-glucanotransferase